MMLRGQESGNHGVLLIKSILLFRQSPIHLHLLVDSTARHVMGTLLRTWHLYGLEYHFYHTEWTYNNLLAHILPISVDRVIFIEPQVLVSVDIRHLWAVFAGIRQGNVFGAVHHSGGQEFRTELMLLDVERLRQNSRIRSSVLSLCFL